GVWHFYSEPDQGGGADTVLPAGSLLAKWQSSANAEEKQRLAGELQKLLVGGTAGLAKDSPDAKLYRQLTSLNGTMLRSILRSSRGNEAQSSSKKDQSVLTSAATEWGVDPALFGKHPTGGSVSATSLCVHAPSVIEVRLPADLAEGCEFVATGT